MPTPITSKAEMYRRLRAGLLGHTLPMAETPAEAEEMVKRGGTFGLRSKVSNSGTVFFLSPAEALRLARERPPGTWNLTPMLDDTERVCYGHLTDDTYGWRLYYSTDPKPCKLMPSKDGCAVRWMAGVKVRAYLRHVMDDLGWQTLCALVEAYPDHCVEFSVMASARAAYGPSNVIFWEVRLEDGSQAGVYEAETWGNLA